MSVIGANVVGLQWSGEHGLLPIPQYVVLAQGIVQALGRYLVLVRGLLLIHGAIALLHVRVIVHLVRTTTHMVQEQHQLVAAIEFFSIKQEKKSAYIKIILHEAYLSRNDALGEFFELFVIR